MILLSYFPDRRVSSKSTENKAHRNDHLFLQQNQVVSLRFVQLIVPSSSLVMLIFFRSCQETWVVKNSWSSSRCQWLPGYTYCNQICFKYRLIEKEKNQANQGISKHPSNRGGWRLGLGFCTEHVDNAGSLCWDGLNVNFSKAKDRKRFNRQLFMKTPTVYTSQAYLLFII